MGALQKEHAMGLSQLTNCELFRKYVKEGSQEALGLFFQNQTDLFYRISLKYTKNSADAEDVLQSSLLKIIKSADQYRGIDSNEEKLLIGWCLRIVANYSINKIHSKKVRRRNESNYIEQYFNENQEEADMGADEEKKIIIAKVKEEIMELPEKYRMPIHLRYVEGFDLETIGNILELNGNTLRSIMKRGLDRLQERLKAKNITLPSVALVGLIQQVPLEKAPLSTKMVTENIFKINVKTTHSSVRRASISKTTSSFWSYFVMVVVVASVGLGVFVMQQNKKTFSEPIALIANNSALEQKSIAPALTEQELNIEGVWLEEDTSKVGVEDLFKQLSYDKKTKTMRSSFNEINALSIPLKPQKKAFVIEVELMCLADQNRQGLITHAALWANNENMALEYLEYQTNESYLYTTLDLQKQQFYFYENTVLNFAQNKCIGIKKFNENEVASRVIFLSQNIAYRKITIRTFDTPPETITEILKKAESFQTKKKTSAFIRARNIRIDYKNK